jgi:hypothetical protein
MFNQLMAFFRFLLTKRLRSAKPCSESEGDKKSPFSGLNDISYENGQLVGGGKRGFSMQPFGRRPVGCFSALLARPVWISYGHFARALKNSQLTCGEITIICEMVHLQTSSIF